MAANTKTSPPFQHHYLHRDNAACGNPGGNPPRPAICPVPFLPHIDLSLALFRFFQVPGTSDADDILMRSSSRDTVTIGTVGTSGTHHAVRACLGIPDRLEGGPAAWSPD